MGIVALSPSLAAGAAMYAFLFPGLAHTDAIIDAVGDAARGAAASLSA